jgi:hypothetical protein
VKKRGIVWLASYPKSGNTWFRIFLRNLLLEREEEADLDEIGFTIASDRSAFDEIAGLESSDMTHDEVDLLRPRVYEAMVDSADCFPIFMKIHDAYTRLPNGEPIVSARATAAALYFVRNPFDVAVSYAHHRGHGDIERCVADLCSEDNTLSGKSGRLAAQLRQRLGSWSAHVRGWVDAAELSVHVLRYEDMKLRPLEMFTAAVRFAGLDHGEDRIRDAIEKSSFERLRAYEEEHGFREKLRRQERFFRKGEIGSWRGALAAEQVERLVRCHEAELRRFGYIDENGEPVF